MTPEVGELAMPGDPSSFAAAITRAASRPEAGRAGRARAEALFSWGRTFDRLLEVRALGVTRVGATATKAILDECKARLQAR